MDPALLARILQSPRLPSFPAVALEVIELVQQRDAPLKRIVQTISHDPALSSRILRAANSSFYGQTRPVSTISRAIVVLGLSAVRALALGFMLVGRLREARQGAFDHMRYWKRSLYSAAAARCLAAELRLESPEEAFLGGLLEDVGMLAMAETLGDEYAQVVAGAGASHRLLPECERQVLGADHAEVGAALAESWKLPPVLVACIRGHEHVGHGEPTPWSATVRCVAVANRAADFFVENQPQEALERYCDLAQALLSLSLARAESLLGFMHSDTVELQRLFDLPTGRLDSPEQIMARANEALLELSLEQQARSRALEEQTRRLAEQAHTDPLTRLANRRRFEQFVQRQLELCRRSRTPLSLLMIDVDHFKRINDAHGHPTGDRVLVALAGQLQSATPPTGLASRVGGEEFAIVLPGASGPQAVRIAEHLRRAVAATPLALPEGEVLSVTISIGLTTVEHGAAGDPEEVVRCADHALYAAKTAGRNCLRVARCGPLGGCLSRP